MDAVTISVLSATVVLQLLATAYCRGVLTKSGGSSSMQALIDDHLNDVMINLIGGVPAVLGMLIVIEAARC
jgi:hypothetical protein